MGIVDRITSKLGAKLSPPEVYLGDIAVVPRRDFKRLLEMGWESRDTDHRIKAWIGELIDLPLVKDIREISKTALSLDILVSNYQCGSDAFNWSEPVIPFAWRPSVKLHGRLIRLRDGKILGTFAVTKRITWKTYIVRVLSIQGMFGGASAFGKTDMQYLLGQALVELLRWVQTRRRIVIG